jgi:hypothetical protein
MTVQEISQTEDRGIHGKTFQHPAFGQIRVNRVSGHKHLFGSDFTHQHYVIVEIETCELVRSLNHDRYHSDRPIIRVAMSEAQWAAFVSSMGRQGAPCTIERLGLESVPDLPPPTDRKKQSGGEMSRKLAKVVERLKAAAANAKTVTHRKEIEGALQELTSNIDFIAESFDEHMENTVEAAKAEVHGYINHTIQRAGLQALTGGDLLTLEDTREQAALEDHSQESSK